MENKTYWNKKGKYQKEMDILYKKLVKSSGMSETIKGEVLRCVSRFYYDYYNNGLCNNLNYEQVFINEFCEYHDIKIKPLKVNFTDEGAKINFSREELEEVVNSIMEYLIKEFKEILE